MNMRRPSSALINFSESPHLTTLAQLKHAHLSSDPPLAPGQPPPHAELPHLHDMVVMTPEDCGPGNPKHVCVCAQIEACAQSA